MESEELQKLKKTKGILLLLVPLTAFMAAMKFLGVFSVGSFPVYTEAVISVFALLYLVHVSRKIKSLEQGS